jgi:CopG family nickel-responsive transcriptional regulator
MSELLRFGVSAEDDLLAHFDELIAAQGYANRSEALRDLMRDALVRQRAARQPEDAPALGSLTLVYDHHARHLTEQMDALQHDKHDLVVSKLHVHLSHDDCMEVIVLRGPLGEIRALAHALQSLKGVKHGQLFVTFPGREITGHARHHHG